MDTEDCVALHAVVALGNIVVNNIDEEGNNYIEKDTIQLIVQAMVQRTTQAIQGKNAKDAEKMLKAVKNTVSMSDEQIAELLPALITFCEQIMSSDLSEDLKKVAIQMFEEICENVSEVRK